MGPWFRHVSMDLLLMNTYKFFSFRNPTPALFSDKYNFCQKCFNDIPGDTVSLGDDPAQPPK